MVSPIDPFIGILGILAVAFPAIVIIWFTIITALTNEKLKDLQAGQSARGLHIAGQLSSLDNKLASTRELLGASKHSFDTGFTADLRANLEELLSLASEIQTIKDAQPSIISTMRMIRGNGIFFIIGIAVAVSLLAINALNPIILVIEVFWVYTLFILYSKYLNIPYTRYRRITRLLKKKDLDKVAK